MIISETSVQILRNRIASLEIQLNRRDWAEETKAKVSLRKDLEAWKKDLARCEKLLGGMRSNG